MPQEYKLILKHADEPGYTPDIECYLRHGGYDALKKALALQPKDLPDGAKRSGPEQIRQEVMASGLRGRGGAGFSCGMKWSFVDRKSGKPIYLICNADESEPGTFKDRQIIYKDPHQFIEGMIISCFANDVQLAYIYIRGEIPDGAKLLNKCLQEARTKNFLGKNILGAGYDWKCTCIAARAPIFAARKPASSNRSKASGLSAHQAAVFPGGAGSVDVPDHRQ